jgi:PAS domain S-box-containing protein
MDGTCLDITERKEAELKLATERYFIQKLTDTSPDVITLYDLEQGMNLYSSREIYSLLGYSPEEMARIVQLGQSAFVDYFHPDDLANIFNFLETYKTYQGEAPREMEYRIKNAAGQWVWINDRYSVFRRNADGFPSQIMGVARNVSERKQAEQEIQEKNGQLQEAYEEMAAAQEELRQTNEELSRINDELERRVGERTVQLAEALEETRRQNQALLQTNTDLDNFVYTASHDLKSPVTNLEGLLGVFQRKVSKRLESSESKLVDMMEASVLKLKATIIGLLEITRAQKDLPEEREMVSFEEVIEEVKADISTLLIESEARLQLQLNAKGIRSARTHVRSIIYNLLSNALKYRSPDRTPDIRISTHQEGSYLVLCVEDNGLGLSESQQSQLFKMFKRLHDHVEGSGIGLYIIKRIVDNQGGTIQVESQEGKGTTFRVYLLNSNTSD